MSDLNGWRFLLSIFEAPEISFFSLSLVLLLIGLPFVFDCENFDSFGKIVFDRKNKEDEKDASKTEEQ